MSGVADEANATFVVGHHAAVKKIAFYIVLVWPSAHLKLLNKGTNSRLQFASKKLSYTFQAKLKTKKAFEKNGQWCDLFFEYTSNFDRLQLLPI